MLLFNKKDMQIICKYDGETVTFSKSLKEILKYQYKYNYRFKLYDTQNNTPSYYISDDYFIHDKILAVSFGGFDILYSSDGASYVPSSGDEGGSCIAQMVHDIDNSNYYIERSYKDFLNGKITTVYIAIDESIDLRTSTYYTVSRVDVDYIPYGENDDLSYAVFISLTDLYLGQTVSCVYIQENPVYGEFPVLEIIG